MITQFIQAWGAKKLLHEGRLIHCQRVLLSESARDLLHRRSHAPEAYSPWIFLDHATAIPRRSSWLLTHLPLPSAHRDEGREIAPVFVDNPSRLAIAVSVESNTVASAARQWHELTGRWRAKILCEVR